MREQKVWRGRHRGVEFKIVNWYFESDISLSDFPSGNWNYYIYIREKDVKDFQKIFWLKDIVSKEFENYVIQDYFSSEFSDISMHGGMTYYNKLGHTKGFRAVELGCDYLHSWDMGNTYNQEGILYDVKKTIDEVIERYFINKENLPVAHIKN